MTTQKVIQILHLEDDPSDSILVQSVLKKAEIAFEYFFADNKKDYCSFLENQEIDLILSDYHLPDYSGNEALAFAKTKYPQLPFVFLSGAMGEDAAIQSLLNGATDYVLKNKMERLVPAVNRAINEAREHKARQIAEKETIKTILVAEDEDSNFMLIEELLSDSEINILRARNGSEAVEICETNRKIDLVLMDIKMPIIDGYEATLTIRKFNQRVPILAQTAYSSEADMRKSFESGCNDFISKPYKGADLISKINELLSKGTHSA